MTATNLIQHYNRLNGKLISPEKLKEFHSEIQRYIDSVGHGEYVPDLVGISKRIAHSLKMLDGQDYELAQVGLIPIDINKHEGNILRVASGYDKEKATEKAAKNSVPAKNLIAEDIDIKKVHTDTKRFQNRTDAFSEASADSVAKNYDPNKFDPIVVWQDAKAKKIFVLSGHSRFEGMIRRKSKTIAVRYFKGSEDEAIRFAKVEANRVANQENLIEDLSAFRLMRDGDPAKKISKATKTELAKIFKGKVQKLEAYSHLSGGGLWVNALSQSTTSNYPYLERNAQWIGILRKENAIISNSGEDNIFHFFYSDKTGKNLKINKDEFFKLANRKINQLGKGEGVLFPECTSNGCVKVNDKETDPIKGESYKRLREVSEQLAAITEKLNSKDIKVRVTTEDEKKYLRTTAEKLQAEKEKIQRDLDVMDKSQSSLFGTEFDKKILGVSDPVLYGLEDKILPGEKVDTSLGFTQDGQKKIYDMITDKVIKTMDKDGLFWRTKWEAGNAPIGRSYPSGRDYRGANMVMLTFMANLSFGYSSPYFLTFNAIKEEGGTLRKKSIGWPVVYYNMVYKLDGKNINEKQYDALPKEVQKTVVKFPFLAYYTVFNAQDVEGVDFPETNYMKKLKGRTEFERLERAEQMVEQMPNRPDIDHGNRTAHFLPSQDKIDMPPRKSFEDAQSYYSVLFHELIHSTGHKSRLNRPMSGAKDSKEYAFEELVAELGASYLCAEAGILYHTINDSAVYVKHYSAQLKEIIKDDNKFFLKAAAAAQKAADYIMDYKYEATPTKDKSRSPKQLKRETFKAKARGTKAKNKKLSGTQTTAFDVATVKPTKGKLNRLQLLQLQESIKAGATTKVYPKAKGGEKKSYIDTPLFAQATNNPRQASLFGSKKNMPVKSTALTGLKYFTYALNDKYRKDLFKLNSDSVVMVSGEPGSGKTVYLLELAQFLSAQLDKKTLYVSEEEYGRSTFDEKIQKFKIGNENLYFDGDLNEDAIENFDIIFLDSVNSLQLKVADIKALIKKYPNKTWFLILQTTKDGDFRGGQDWKHLVDIACEVRNRKLILPKNRLDENNATKAEKLYAQDEITKAHKKLALKKAIKAGTFESDNEYDSKQKAA